ncbi:MAG: lysophospholipid acyltransferase family protein, partial [Chthoniobacterales bacterium]|nr:lysophospholipid acyltransferase family protein [Chthoniobacterales bacterium]
MLDLSVYILYRIACGLISALPLPIVFSLGKLAGAVAWLLLPGYRRLARLNLEIAFAGEKPASEVRALTRRHFRRLGANFLSGIKLSTMEIDEIAIRVELENIESFHRELRAGRPVVLVLSHLGNWEVAAQLLPKHVGYVRSSTVYQPLRNRRIDADIRQRRARTGLEMFDRKEGFRKPIELLRSGGVVGILSDQHAGDHGIWTPFFGRLASTTPLPALLAKRTGAAVITAAVHTTGPGRWRITFTGPLNSEADSVASLTFRANL